MTDPKVTHAAAARILADRDPVIDRLLFLTGPPKLAPPVEGHFAAPHDRDGLAHPGQRMAERDAVQALDDLRAACAEAEQEPAIGQVCERHRGLRDRDWRPEIGR